MDLGDTRLGQGSPVPQEQYTACLERLWQHYIRFNKQPHDTLATTHHHIQTTGLVLPSEHVMEAALQRVPHNSFLKIALQHSWRKAFQYCHDNNIYILCPSSRAIDHYGADKRLTFYWILAHALRIVHGFYTPTSLSKAPQNRGTSHEKRHCITYQDSLHDEIVSREIMACRLTKASQKERMLEVLKRKGAFFIKMYVLPNVLEMEGETLHIYTQNKLHFHILLESFSPKDKINIHLMR